MGLVPLLPALDEGAFCSSPAAQARYGIKGKYAAQECVGKLPQPDMTNVAVWARRTFGPASTPCCNIAVR
jgi:hypothetical protein